LNLTSEDKQVITELALLSGEDENIVIKIFESYLIYITLNYKNKKNNRIPMIGSFYARYENDETTPEGKEAVITSFFNPSNEIKRIVGQMHDIEESGNYNELDTFQILRKKLNKDFKLVINDKGTIEE
jgi:hypothetical protein